MILHCSQKLAAKLHDVSPTPLEETSPLGSWHGNLYRFDRRQSVMLIHDASRYVLFLPGMRKAQFDELGTNWFRPLYLASLATIGCADTQITKAELALGPVRYDRATDRSVHSSLRVAKQDLEAWIYRVPNVMMLDPLLVSRELNDRPATVYGKWIRPSHVMRNRIAVL